MHRRALVRRLASALPLGAIAGCASNREVPVTAPAGPVEQDDAGGARTATTGPGDSGRTTARRLVVPDWEASAGTGGMLVVTVTVRNRGRKARTSLLRVIAGAGNDEYVGERFVSLDAGERTAVELAFPVEYEAFDARPSLSFDILARTPETPLPRGDSAGTSGESESPSGDDATG